MKFRRHTSPAITALIISLPLILVGLAALQYYWLTEISRAERERLQARLQTDARRLAQDFNAEISRAYFIFQVDARVFETGAFGQFAGRFDSWNASAAFPNIIGEIYFVGERDLQRFNPAAGRFESVAAAAPVEIGSLRDRLLTQKREGASNFTYDTSLIDERIPSLTVPIFRSDVNTTTVEGNVSSRTETITKHRPEGFIIIKFDRAALTSEMLPELIRKNFSADAESYDFSINDSGNGEVVFQSAPLAGASTSPDAAARLFELSSETAPVVVLNGDNSDPFANSRGARIVRERIDRSNLPGNAVNVTGGGYQTSPDESRKVRVVRKGKDGGPVAEKPADSGLWVLSVRHKAGSLENFVGRTKWRNLSLSFGALALLGASVALLLVSALRSKRAAQRQFDFVSSVSHEFRTPVAVIRSAGTNLSRGIIRDPAQVKKYGDVIEREGGRLGEMVEQILEFAGARSNRKHYVFQSVAVVPLVEQALADSRSLLEQDEFEIEKHFAPDLPLVSADAKTLRKAVENLIGNAVKYSGANRRIKISAFLDGDYVAVEVEDQGIGIAARDLKNIFEPFYRGREAVAEQIHGSGLGLSLVKQIVAAHDGKISVKSEPGAGSKFTIRLSVKSNGAGPNESA